MSAPAPWLIVEPDDDLASVRAKTRRVRHHAVLAEGPGIEVALCRREGLSADHDWRAYLLTAVCTLIFVFTMLNPLIVVVAAGVIGYFGVV